MFKKGQISDAPSSDSNGKLKKIPSNSVIRRIVVCFDGKDYVMGIKFLNANGYELLEVGTFLHSKAEILLEAEERIVGIRSRLHHASKA